MEPTFDAGQASCADGVARDLRARMKEVAPGERLLVIVRDPAAREDLPPLVRMFGHKLLSTEQRPDGSWAFLVERGTS